MRKKLISLLLAASMAAAFCFPASAAAVTFGDVQGEAWYFQAVEKAYANGLVNGIGGGKFAPGNYVTYAEFAQMLSNISWANETATERLTYTADSKWWEAACIIAGRHGVFANTPMDDACDWSFYAAMPVPRSDMAMMAYNFLYDAGKCNTDEVSMTIAKSRIDDISHLDEAHKNAILSCYAEGVLNGTGGKHFGPNGNMTRAQAAVVLVKVYDMVKGNNSQVSTPAPAPNTTTKPADAIGGHYDTAVYSVPADANKDGWITEAEVQARIEELKVQYKPGTLWNDASVWGTDRNSADGYVSNGLHYYTSKTIGGGSGCAGWAKLLSDRIFGNLPWRQFSDVYSLRPGDIVADMGTPHWMVYTKPEPENANYMRATCSPTSL